MGRYIKKTGQTTPVNAVVENTWSRSTVNAPSVAMVQDALVGENMLINSDFRHGAINQKGQSSYNTQYQYDIDMWYQISTGTLTVNDDSISTSANLKQFFDEQPEDGDYTVAISVDGALYTYTFEGFTGTSKTHNFSIGSNTLGVEMLTKQIILYMNGNTFNIDFVKLEKGKHFTGMPAWNQYKELDRCIKYFDTKSSFRLPMCERSNVATVKTYSFSLPRTHYMHKVPTISVMGNAPVDSVSGICLRKFNDVSQSVHIVGYSFEVRDWELVIKVNVDDSVDVDNTDVQLFIGQQFIICFDAYQY